MQRVGFGSVFVLVLSSVVLEIVAGEGSWLVSVQTLLGGATAFGVVLAAGLSRHTRHTAGLAVTVVVVVALVSTVLAGGETRDAGADVVRAALAATAIALIARWFGRRPWVDLQAVAAALCVYLLWGIVFSRLYGLVAALDADPLFAQGDDGSTSERMYFSFVTLTTTGFGDYSMAESLGRGLAVVEAVGGQLYLVSVVALLVGNLGRPRQRPGRDRRQEPPSAQ